MATFRVKLGTGDGQLTVREAHGNSAEEVSAFFTGEGFFVFSVERRMDMATLVGLRRKLPAKQFITFNKEFRGLIKAGLPVAEGLDIILKRMKQGRLRNMLESVRESLHKGRSLSQAFGDFESIIPRYYPALLLAGEQSGGLADVLEQFIDQESRIRAARKKFVQALTYPALLLSAAVVAMYIILTRAMPQFASFYATSDQELPALTEMVVGFSNWLSAWWGWLLIGTFAVVMSIWFYFQTEAGGLLGERLIRRLPLVGRLWYLSTRNIFTRTMRMLTMGGVTVPNALSVTAGAIPSRLFSSNLRQAHGAVMQGMTLQEALDSETDFDEDVGEMVRIGEATGNLAEMFDYLSESGEEQAEDTLALLSNLVAPIMLLLVGLLIAFLVVSMYLPMFGSYGSVV